MQYVYRSWTLKRVWGTTNANDLTDKNHITK